MIDIKNITKSFGSLQVLKGIDLHINKGEVVSIVGPSGAGSHTHLRGHGHVGRCGVLCHAVEQLLSLLLMAATTRR